MMEISNLEISEHGSIFEYLQQKFLLEGFFFFVTEICVIYTNFKRFKTDQRAVLYTLL